MEVGEHRDLDHVHLDLTAAVALVDDLEALLGKEALGAQRDEGAQPEPGYHATRKAGAAL